MELLPMPEGHGLKFVTRSQLGAGVYVVTNYPPVSFPDFEVPRISRKTWKARGPANTGC